MSERINTLRELQRIIESAEPREFLYDLGEGENRTELLATYMDGSSSAVNRITSSPVFSFYEADDGLAMDIRDSDQNADGYSYDNLRPRGAVFMPPDNPPHELGDLVIDLQDNRKLALSQYERKE